MLYESRKNRRRKSPMLMRGINSQPLRKHSAKIQIISDNAIPKLKELSKLYQNKTEVKGFLTDLRLALGIPNSKGASKYGFVKIKKGDKILEFSIRLTNHNSNASTYITQNTNYEYNLSLVIRKRFRPNTFKPNDKVRLDEYVYFEERLRNVENPLSKIIDEIIHFIETGEYRDPTDVAFLNQSFRKINTKNESNKKYMKITKRELKQMINEAVVDALRNNKNSGNFYARKLKDNLNWSTLENAMRSFDKGIKKFKYVRAEFWQVDVTSSSNIEEFIEDLNSSNYKYPSLYWWTIQTNSISPIDFDEELSDEIEELITNFMGIEPDLGTSKMSIYWRTDELLDIDDLKFYYKKLSKLDKMIDQYLKDRR